MVSGPLSGEKLPTVLRKIVPPARHGVSQRLSYKVFVGTVGNRYEYMPSLPPLREIGREGSRNHMHDERDWRQILWRWVVLGKPATAIKLILPRLRLP